MNTAHKIEEIKRLRKDGQHEEAIEFVGHVRVLEKTFCPVFGEVKRELKRG